MYIALYYYKMFMLQDNCYAWRITIISQIKDMEARLGSYNPSPDPTLCGSFYALGLSFKDIKS
jgi:hypothetical protein